MPRPMPVLALSLLFMALSAGAEPALPKVGVLMPFTGEIAHIAEKIRKGFVLAEEEYAGRVEVIYEDIGGLGAAKAVSAATKLVEIDDVRAVVGPFGPEQTIPVASVAARKGISLLSFTLCSRTFEKMANVFCGYPSIPLQLRAMRGVLAARDIASLSLIVEESEFGNESAAGAAALAHDLKIAVPYQAVVPPNDRDLRAIAAQVVKAKASAVFAAFADPAMAFVFLRQLRDAGFTGTRFAFIDYDDKYLAEFGEFTEGLLVPGAFTGDYQRRYRQRYQERYHEEPDVYSAEAYDLLRTAIKALEANGWSEKGLKERIPALDYADTAIPGFRFNVDRTVEFPMGVLIARGGRFVAYQ